MSLVIDLKKKAMATSRKKKLNHFYSLYKEGESVLDVGVSAESAKGLPARNYFLKKYQYDYSLYTGLGVQDMTGMEDLFPGRNFVQYEGGRFPFLDKKFDWVFCNAVIEHVGDRNSQLFFLNEMMRVANNVFFTTPNKYFPVESHTNIFFLHWNDQLFYRWCKKNKVGINKDNLYLLSFCSVKKLLEKSNATSISKYKNRLVGIPMTFTIICTDNNVMQDKV